MKLDKETIAAYLTGILEANNPALLASALGVRLVAQPAGVQRNLRLDHY